ncbi:hypothetical protein HMPREF1214_01810 [Bacteroides sp. HPS0048]|uniref:hypothetical protein n=1 Tax=Bacteroides sp. HPS0048 TaxID=1078089 RepID=UPI00036BFF82|nr:hypothetical protein [Bacteroides sp. HPS0048]EOA58975.1 hypothetical protein HMPREF1214_01810 [Bacteroides sp. HPS0048]
MAQKKHLSEDEIKVIISAETAEAQQEIHALTKETKELKKEERARRKAMVDLESQGKKNSKAYKNLEKEVKEYSNRISENTDKVRKLTRQLDVNAMSMRQLKYLAKELTGELEDMSEAANPEEYAALSNQLRSVRMRMDDLRNKGRNISTEFGSAESMLSKWKTAAKAFIAVKLVGYLTQLNSAVYRTRKEFAKYEAVLRNTFQSQEKAAQAMKMLQQLAADTPGSLKEWTEAFIKLVNRGIKPTSSELTNMGDLAASQGKSIDQFIEAVLDAMSGENERLKEFGIKANKNGNTVKYTFRGVTTEVQNSDEAIKNYLLSLGQLEGVAGSMAVQMKELEGVESNFGDTIDNMWNKIGKRMEPFFKKMYSWASSFVSDITKAVEPLSDTFDDQLEKVVKLEMTLPGMTKRYEELAGKLNRNADEQKELNTLIANLSSIVPSAVSEWDQYGNVISLNTSKIHDYLNAEKARLNYVHREEIKNLKEKQENAKKEIELLAAQNERGKVWAGGTGYGNTKDQGMRVITDAERAKNTERIKQLKEDLAGIDAQLDKISGSGIEKIVQDRIKSQKDMTAAQERFNNMNKSMLSAWLKDEKNAADQYREIAEEIYKNRFPDKPADPKAAQKAQAAAEKEKKATLDTEKAAIQSMETLREEDLQNQQKWYNTSVYAFNADLSEKLITKEQHELLMIELDKQNAENRLKIEQAYYQDAQSLELKNADLKEDLVRKSNQRVLDSEKSANAARAVEQAKLNDLIKDFKSQFKVTTVKEDFQAQMSVLEAAYQARKEMAEKNNLDTTEIDRAYYAANEQLEADHKAKILAIRNQYGLSTQQERFDTELLQLKTARDQQLLTEEEYEQAVQNLKRDSYKKQFDYYSGLFSGAVQALQQAEMDNVDAQYDAEIEAAKGNSKEVERLENEKAQKKLDIQKKYADVNFAIKTSQIIADTAVSIMKAFSDLGPIAGAVAAALMGITGAAQIASANAERKKVKNMTLSGSSSSSKSGARVATGRESGGKIDVKRAQDGKFFPNTDYDPDARGFIDRPTVIVGEGPSGHSKEWVASNAAVSNPTIAPILDILDKSQQAGTIRTLDLNQVIRARMAGYSSGGTISKTTVSSPDPVSSDSGVTLTPELMRRFANAIINIDEYGIPASVSLTEFERKQQLRDRSRNLAKK